MSLYITSQRYFSSFLSTLIIYFSNSIIENERSSDEKNPSGPNNYPHPLEKSIKEIMKIIKRDILTNQKVHNF